MKKEGESAEAAEGSDDLIGGGLSSGYSEVVGQHALADFFSGFLTGGEEGFQAFVVKVEGEGCTLGVYAFGEGVVEGGQACF